MMIFENSKNELAFISVLSCCFGALVSWRSGQDINWDWQNYHDYGAWALLNGRLWIDVAPGSIQTFINPVVLFPDYLLRNLFPLPLGSLIEGSIQALVLVFVWLIAGLALERTWMKIVATICAASGPLFISLIGTSFPDIISAIPIMAGLYMILRVSSTHSKKTLVAGVMLGIGVGLKLTNASFAVGAVAIVLMRPDRLQFVSLLIIGGAVGWIISAGPWAFILWNEFSSPIFPFYDGIFGSPEGPGFNIRDDRFFPDTFSEWLAYPFLWLAGQHPTVEMAFRDWRFALIVILGAVAGGFQIGSKRGVFSRVERELFVFFVVSFVTWSLVFSIQRYLVPLELLAGPVILILLVRVFPTKISFPLAAAVATILVATSQPPNWGRRPWSDPYILPESLAAFTDPAIFFLLDVPTSFIVRHLPTGSQFFSVATRHHVPIHEGGKFDMRINDALKSVPSGGLWTINVQGLRNNIDGLEQYGLKISDNTGCKLVAAPATSFTNVSLEFCPLIKLDM